MGTSNLAVFYQGQRTLKIKGIPLAPPTLVQSDQVRVRVTYCGICGSDIHIYHGDMDNRVGDNRIIGHEVSGRIEVVGKNVRHLTPGQKVSIRPIQSCGKCPACRSGYQHVCHHLNCIGVDSDGAMRQVWDLPADLLYPLPDDLPLCYGALVEPTAIACHAVRLSQIQFGEHVVVIGSGAIGLLVAVIAKMAGGKVVILEVNSHRIELARTLGFTVMNPNDTDVYSEIMHLSDQAGASVVYEVSGTQSGVDLMTQIAASRGRIIMVAIHPHPPRVDLLQVFRRELSIIGSRIQESRDFTQAIELLANQNNDDSDKIPVKTLISDIYPLAEVQLVFDKLDNHPTSLKTLIQFNLENSD